MTHHWICIVTEGDVILEFSVLELDAEDSGTLSLFELGVPKVCFFKNNNNPPPSFIRHRKKKKRAQSKSKLWGPKEKQVGCY